MMKTTTLARWTLAGVGLLLVTAGAAATVLARRPQWLTAHEND